MEEEGINRMENEMAAQRRECIKYNKHKRGSVKVKWKTTTVEDWINMNIFILHIYIYVIQIQLTFNGVAMPLLDTIC